VKEEGEAEHLGRLLNNCGNYPERTSFTERKLRPGVDKFEADSTNNMDYPRPDEEQSPLEYQEPRLRSASKLNCRKSLRMVSIPQTAKIISRTTARPVTAAVMRQIHCSTRWMTTT